MFMKKNTVTLLFICVFAAGVFAGGGQSGGSVAASASAGAFSYPIPGNKTFTINMDPIDVAALPDWAKNDYFWTVLERKTGVKLQMIGAQSGGVSVTEAFTLLLASGDYPDIMVANWLYFPGGPDKALSEGYIIPLNDRMENAPNMAQLLKDDPKFNKDVRTDDGVLYAFPFYRDDYSVLYAGASIRQDWLDKLGLPVPETVADWHKVLTAFKQFTAGPFTFESRYLFMSEYFCSIITNPWGVAYPFYVENNTVKFGPLEKGYRDFVTEMNKWYNEGLIDKDMPSINKATVSAKFSNGNAGLVIQQSTQMDEALFANKDNPDYKIIGLKTPVLKPGDERKFGHRQNNYPGNFSWGISSKTKDVPTVMRYIDYFFGLEGRTLSAYGTEGVSYEVKNGQVQILQSALNHPEITSARSVIESFFGNPHNHALYELEGNQRVGITPAVALMKEQWMDNNIKKYAFPPVTQTAAESDTIGAKWTNIDTYCQEMIIKFIIGTEPLSGYDRFLATLKTYGIDDVLKARQAAYDRYQTR
jgi:putative aldouronate transport system substrate-binding protein